VLVVAGNIHHRLVYNVAIYSSVFFRTCPLQGVTLLNIFREFFSFVVVSLAHLLFIIYPVFGSLAPL
jgi:hypothetical protein